MAISSAFVTAIQVTPANQSLPLGLTQAYIAIGTFNDGSTLDISPDVDWVSAAPSFASIDTTGLVTAVGTGNTTITATQESVSSIPVNLQINEAVIRSLEITPAIAITAEGLEQQYQAIATYSDGSHPDISDDITWSSSNPELATITSDGTATGVASGLVEITAESSGATSPTAYLYITRAVINGITVTPQTASIAKGTTQQFQAIASSTDGNTLDISSHSKVGWQSSDTATATIDLSGLARGIKEGSSDIKATLAGRSSSLKTLTVIPAVVSSIAVNPPEDFLISKGAEILYSATAIWSDNTSQEITGTNQANWSSDNNNVATVSLSGSATGVASDTAPALVSATLQGFSGSSRLVGVSCTSITNSGLQYVCSLEDKAADLFNLAFLTSSVDNTLDGLPEFVLMDWTTANDYCNDLHYNGFTDWLLPTTSELFDLFNTFDGKPTVPNVLVDDYDWPVKQSYWTSVEGGVGEHIAISLGTGLDETAPDATTKYAGCVRTASQP